MSDIYLSLTETPTVVTLSQPVVSGVLSSSVTVTNVVSVNVVTMPAITVQAAAPAVTTVAGSVAVSNLGLVPSSVATDGTADGTLNFVKIGGHQSGSNQTAHIVHVSAGGSMKVDATDSVVSISNFPLTQTIAGTVTANLTDGAFTDAGAAIAADDGGGQPLYGIQLGYNDPIDGFQLLSSSKGLPISGTVTVGNSVTIGSLPAISGTVTANSIFPRVTFIDGSGTVATANTAITVFASSSTRSYLLVQVTTGSAFVNVGATATTVNGINLTAGQGYSWETTIPQGIVSLISTTTSSRYVAKEA